jgi:hypothetical protein
MSEEKYFFVQLPGCGETGPKAEMDISVHPPRVLRLHCLMDMIPMSDIFEIYPSVVVTKAFGEALTRANCSGFTLKAAHFEPSEYYREFHASEKLPDLIWCDITGESGLDDFGLERGMRLIVSRRVKDIIERHSHDEVFFFAGAKAPTDEEITRFLFDNAEKVAKKIYQNRRRLNK